MRGIGGLVPILGEVVLHVELSSLQANIEFRIVPTEMYGILLGKDVLKKFGGVEDHANHTIFFSKVIDVPQCAVQSLEAAPANKEIASDEVWVFRKYIDQDDCIVDEDEGDDLPYDDYWIGMEESPEVKSEALCQLHGKIDELQVSDDVKAQLKCMLKVI
eukprot:TRINITY_DN3872_c0_g1_i2.p1 TRINITY_DN3872_c0_g1~~TRINITY_DN3872_c0_g1_i2.p1  ORF type:complete len:160 (-),score=52.36 TRINITY_DN3872_c0_g1_i2:6-485(-)